MSKADEIRADMRARVERHHEEVAQQTAQLAIDALGEIAKFGKMRWVAARDLRREDVYALLGELQPYISLLAEVAPSLPAREVVVAEAATGEEKAA